RTDSGTSPPRRLPMKLKALTPLLLGAALVSSFTLPVAALEKDPLRIALISSKSGPFATMGADVLSGVRFAVEEANAKGGVDGRKIVVAEADDESTPDAGRRAAEKLV